MAIGDAKGCMLGVLMESATLVGQKVRLESDGGGYDDSLSIMGSWPKTDRQPRIKEGQKRKI
jgi:hypothetical protein